MGAKNPWNSGKGTDNLQATYLQIVDPLLPESYFLRFTGILLVLFQRDFNADRPGRDRGRGHCRS